MRKIKAVLLSMGISLFGLGILTTAIGEPFYSFGVGMSVVGVISLIGGIIFSWYVEYKEKKNK